MKTRFLAFWLANRIIRKHNLENRSKRWPLWQRLLILMVLNHSILFWNHFGRVSELTEEKVWPLSWRLSDILSHWWMQNMQITIQEKLCWFWFENLLRQMKKWKRLSSKVKISARDPRTLANPGRGQNINHFFSGKAMLWYWWCRLDLYKGRYFAAILQSILESQNGSG